MKRDKPEGRLNTGPLHLGQEILAAFDRGRQLAIDRAKTKKQHHSRMVLSLLLNDLTKNLPARGRPGRIRRRLLARGETLSERHVGRIISDLLMSVSDLKSVQPRNGGTTIHGPDSAPSPRSGAQVDRGRPHL